MSIRVQTVSPADQSLVANIADGVFDYPLDPEWTAAFFAAPNHHLAIALEGDLVVGMATAVHYVHPDKAPELWINEVGVSPTHRRQNLGRRLITALLESGKAVGCRGAWTLTREENVAARGLFASLGGREVEAGTLMVSFDLD